MVKKLCLTKANLPNLIQKTQPQQQSSANFEAIEADICETKVEIRWQHTALPV